MISLDIFNHISSFYQKVKRLFQFIPHIWNSYDFDSQYAVDLFAYQLSRTADHFESENATSIDAEKNAMRIRTVLRLLENVYEEKYATKCFDIIKEKYGKGALDFEYYDVPNEELPEELKSIGHNLISLRPKYESWPNAKEIKEDLDQEFIKSNNKQEKAHRILWKLIDHNIRQWWD